MGIPLHFFLPSQINPPPHVIKTARLGSPAHSGVQTSPPCPIFGPLPTARTRASRRRAHHRALPWRRHSPSAAASCRPADHRAPGAPRVIFAISRTPDSEPSPRRVARPATAQMSSCRRPRARADVTPFARPAARHWPARSLSKSRARTHTRTNHRPSHPPNHARATPGPCAGPSAVPRERWWPQRAPPAPAQWPRYRCAVPWPSLLPAVPPQAHDRPAPLQVRWHRAYK